MADRRKDAFEQLRAQVAAAQAAACANPLWTAPLEDLRALAANHPLGATRSGWKNPYPKNDPRSLLLEYQFASFHDESRFKAELQARQTGKDFSGQGEIAEDCVRRKGTDWMVGAPSERQSLDSLDQGKLWAEGFGLAIESYDIKREGLNPESLLKTAEIVYSNGSRVRAVPGKPDTVRGRSANVYLTEFDFFENPSATWRAILPSITNPLRGGEKKVRIKTTPNGFGSAMHRIWTKEDKRMRWSRRLVTIYHAVLMGLPVDIEQIREALDDADGWQQEYECSFLDQASVLLTYELIAACESTEATTTVTPDFWAQAATKPVAIGWDFARKRDLSVPWTVERVGDVLHTREIEEFRGMSTPAQFKAMEHKIAAARRVCVDYTGPGIGLGDLLVERFGEYKPTEDKFGKIELCTFTPSLKLELFPALKVAFEQRRVRVPVSIAVREDLHSMQRIVTQSGGVTYRAPHTEDGHADRCTALALALRAAGKTSGPFTFQPITAEVHDAENADAWRSGGLLL
jgi:phage FluMu gp28-like protein